MALRCVHKERYRLTSDLDFWPFWFIWKHTEQSVCLTFYKKMSPDDSQPNIMPPGHSAGAGVKTTAKYSHAFQDCRQGKLIYMHLKLEH